jgi:hypothetical protein
MLASRVHFGHHTLRTGQRLQTTREEPYLLVDSGQASVCAWRWSQNLHCGAGGHALALESHLSTQRACLTDQQHAGGPSEKAL